LTEPPVSAPPPRPAPPLLPPDTDPKEFKDNYRELRGLPRR